MTLIECIISLALSALVMAGLHHTLKVALDTQKDVAQIHQLHTDAQLALHRISIAINLAVRQKRQDLVTKATSTSGNWFDRYDEVKKQAVIYRYDWSSGNSALTETEGGSQPVTILENVTDFKVDSVSTSTDKAIVLVTLTVGVPPTQVTLTEMRHLGGAW